MILDPRLWAQRPGILMPKRGRFFSLDSGYPNELDRKKKTFLTIIPATRLEDGRPALTQ